MNPSTYLELGSAALMLVAGLIVLLWPHRSVEKARAAHEAQIRARRARGADAYFEEQRELEAYPPHRSALAFRMLGALLLAAAVLQIFAFVTT